MTPPTYASSDKQAKVQQRVLPVQTGGTMDEMRHLVLGVELDKRTVLVLTGGACTAGALLVLLRNVYNRQQAKARIRRARTRRDESVWRAEDAVLQYKTSVRADDVFMYKSINSINISGLLGKMLFGGLLLVKL